MTSEQQPHQSTKKSLPYSTRFADTYYDLLGLYPWASAIEISRAYRKMSKLYHPDTSTLPAAIAMAKFQNLNEAYATLSSSEKRYLYDLKIGYSRLNVIQPKQPQNEPQQKWSKSAYLDPTDRPLSAGEIFVLFLLGMTFICCFGLAIAIAIWRGDPL